MALVGLGTVTVVALILAVRSSRYINKALSVGLWSVYAAYSVGVIV